MVTVRNFTTVLKNVNMDLTIVHSCRYPKFINDHCLKQAEQISWVLFCYN